MFAFMCWFFGHASAFPRDPWEPIYCGRCGRKRNSATGEWETQKEGGE